MPKALMHFLVLKVQRGLQQHLIKTMYRCISSVSLKYWRSTQDLHVRIMLCCVAPASFPPECTSLAQLAPPGTPRLGSASSLPRSLDSAKSLPRSLVRGDMNLGRVLGA